MDRYIEYLFGWIIGTFAGLIRIYYQTAQAEKKICGHNLISGGLVSGFTALMAYSLCLAWGMENTPLIIFVTGICGWTGATMLDFFADEIKKWISSKGGKH